MILVQFISAKAQHEITLQEALYLISTNKNLFTKTNLNHE